MAKIQQNDERVSHGINLLISILVRFPEIATVNYDAENNTIKFTFMLFKIPDINEFAKFQHLVISSISAYHVLEGTKEVVADVRLIPCDKLAILAVLRDVVTLSKGEITLIIALLRENFKSSLVTDNNDAMLEEDLAIQDEVIDNMLENIKSKQYGKGLIGIREDGKVLVFNK